MDHIDAYHEHCESQPSSMTELVRDQARWDGQFALDKAWLLSDFDTWERNPHYRGPEQPHPESEPCEHGKFWETEGCVECHSASLVHERARWAPPVLWSVPAVGDDEIPF